MRKILSVFLMLTICLLPVSCQNADSNSYGLSSGHYFLNGDYEEPLTPYLQLDFEDHTFAFGEGLIVSYAERGSFKMQGNKLKATSQNTVFIFEMVDENKLILIDSGDAKAFQMHENSEFIFQPYPSPLY